MNTLITGGAGFIGSHLVDRLLREDNKITVIDGHSSHIVVIDDFSEGKYVNLPKDPRLTVYDADILGDIGHLFKDIDIVFHMAALTRPQWSILYPFETDRVNTGGTIRVLEHSRNHKVKRVVFMSSSSMYGENVYPTTEEVIPNPMCPYALTKSIGEQYCRIFEKLYGLEFNAIRPFNVYGSRMNPKGIYSSAVAKFIEVIHKRLPLHITGDGNQARDFIYIDDVIDQMMRMADSTVHGEVFNCGSGTNTSINDLMKIISKLMGVEIKPIYTPPVVEPTQTLSDIRKAEKLLGWKPAISLEEGLRRTIEKTV
ncbi:MAG: NAD-dependent epimerase/dehydratase family protein [Patescibacteria group bacterium]